MKKLILICLLATISTVQAQWFQKRIEGNGVVTVEKRNTSYYNAVNVGGPFEVVLVSGKEGALTIEAEENLMEYIVTEVKNNGLSVRIKDNANVKSRKKMEGTIPSNEIEEVSLAGSGSIRSDFTLKSTNFKCTAAGSGTINISIEAQETHSNIAGSGSINMKGTTHYIEAEVAGSGSIKATDLNSKKAKVAIAGSGSAYVHASEELKAKVAGSGNIYISGNPAKEDTSVAGSGKIKKM